MANRPQKVGNCTGRFFKTNTWDLCHVLFTLVYQKWQGVTFSEPSFWVSMLVFRGVNLKGQNFALKF